MVNKKIISLALLVTIGVSSFSGGTLVKASTLKNNGLSIEHLNELGVFNNKDIVIKDDGTMMRDKLVSYDDSILAKAFLKSQSSIGVRAVAPVFAGKKVYSPNGGTWIRKSGGMDVNGTNAMRVNKAFYVPYDGVVALMAAYGNQAFIDGVNSLGTTVTFAGLDWAAKKFLSATAVPIFTGWLGLISLSFTALEAAGIITDYLNSQALRQAYNNKKGIINVSWQSAYQGKWYSQEESIYWGDTPYAVLPIEVVGVGTYMNN